MNELPKLKPFVLTTNEQYKKLRCTIVTGDVISMRRTGAIWWFFSLFLGKGSPNHSGIAYVYDSVVWCAEMSWSGNHLVRLSSYTTQFNKKVAWVRIDRCPMVNLPVRKRSAAILSTLYSDIRYSGLQLISAGIERLTGIAFKLKLYQNSQICSVFVINSLMKMGLNHKAKMSIIDPQELMELVEYENNSLDRRAFKKE